MNLTIPIARPPWSSLGVKLERSCRKALYDFSLLEGVHKVAVALSGGKDSLSLLFLLHAIRGRGVPFFDLIAIHVDGEFSCGAGVDRIFLSKICKELDIPLVLCSSSKKREELECYSCARERRSLIFKTAFNEGATTIALGHHRDDYIQTLLLNLLQKGEFAAMLPKIHMQHYQVTLIRPLILIPEESIRTFAEQNGFLRISCKCPVGQQSKRRETAQLIKRMEELFPHAKNNLALAGFRYGSDKAKNP